MVRLIVQVVISAASINADTFGAWGIWVNTALTAVDAVLDLYDWYLHANFTNRLTLTSDFSQYWNKSYDIRTARRVRGEQRSLDFVATNNAASGANIVWSVNARMLLKGS